MVVNKKKKLVCWDTLDNFIYDKYIDLWVERCSAGEITLWELIEDVHDLFSVIPKVDKNTLIEVKPFIEAFLVFKPHFRKICVLKS